MVCVFTIVLRPFLAIVMYEERLRRKICITGNVLSGKELTLVLRNPKEMWLFVIRIQVRGTTGDLGLYAQHSAGAAQPCELELILVVDQMTSNPYLATLIPVSC